MRSRLMLTLSTLVLALGLLAPAAEARLVSGKRTFGKPLRPAMTNVAGPRTNKIYLQPATGGQTLMSVISSVKGKPFQGANAYYTVSADGRLDRVRSWGALDKVQLDKTAKPGSPETKIYLRKLTNGSAFVSTKGNNGALRYYYVSYTGQAKELTSYRQMQHVVGKLWKD